jgi:hypothetical protein
MDWNVAAMEHFTSGAAWFFSFPLTDRRLKSNIFSHFAIPVTWNGGIPGRSCFRWTFRVVLPWSTGRKNRFFAISGQVLTPEKMEWDKME